MASRGEIAVNLKFEEIQGISTSSVHAEFKSTICGRLCEPSNWKTNRAAVLARSSSADANVLTCVDSLLDDFGKDLSEKLALEASQIIEELTAKHNKELDDIKQQWCIAEQKVSLAEVDLCVCRLKRDEMLDVDEICRRDTGFTVEERRKVDKLIQKATELHSGRIDGSFKIYRKEFWPMPAPFKGDGDLSKTQLKVKAALLRDVTLHLGVGTKVGAKYLKYHRDELAEAAVLAKFHPKLITFSPEDTDAIILDCGLTGRGWEGMNANVKALGGHVPFAPRNQVERIRRTDEVKCSKQLEISLLDKNGMPCRAAAMVQCNGELVASVFDEAAAKGLLIPGFKLRSDPDADVRHIKLSQDKGGDVVKFTLQPIGVVKNQSVTWARLNALYGPWHKQQKKNPADNLENWRTVLALVDNYFDLESMSIVKVGEDPHCRHALVPKASLPSSGLLTFVDASQADVSALEKHRSGERAGSPKEMELLRASAVPESAVLVVRGGKYVGLRIELAADEDHLYVSFRAPTNVIEGSAVVLRLKVFLSMDLLAQAVAVGCSNQSGCVCLWCDEGPKDFKKTTQSPDSVLTLRTCASQAKNLAVYEAQTGKKKAVCGVTHASLFPALPFSQYILPVLHLSLGAGNALSAFVTNELERLDCQDPVAVAEALQLRECIAELSADAEELLGSLQQKIEDALRDGCTEAVALGGGGGGGGAAEVEADEEGGGEPVGVAQARCEHAIEIAGSCALQLREKAAATRLGDPGRAVRSRGARQIARDEVAATELEKEADDLDESAENALAAAIALDESKAEFDALSVTSGNSGVLTKIYVDLLAEYSIHKEVYWNGQLVGPHLWRWFEHHEAIFDSFKIKAVELGYEASGLDAIFDAAAPALVALAAIVPLMLAARLLTDEELDILETNCAALGATWRLHFAVANGAAHTPKVHLIERHVVAYARLHGTLGMLGEEAVEALHPWWTAAARLCQAMRDPIARILATKRCVEAKQRCKVIVREQKTRQSKKARMQTA